MTQKIILGIDEVGRGPWAGPLVVGAVILGPKFNQFRAVSSETQDEQNLVAAAKQNKSKSLRTKFPLNPTEEQELTYLWEHLADSKAISSKQRELLAPLIRKHAAGTATGWVSAKELDQYGLSASLKLATRRAVKQLLAKKIHFTEIIIDGTINFLSTTPLADRVTTLKKADALIKEVSAAAILAKVERDNYMTKIAEQYPEYGFEKHVGYGTAAHQSALEKHGICPEHRQSFRPIQKFTAGSSRKTTIKTHNSTTERGQTAESVVINYLENLNHTIISRNFKTKTYEIDIISTLGDDIYFTEVKYSQNPAQEITPLSRITTAKHKQMAYAAEKFLSSHPKYQSYNPKLAAAAVTGTTFSLDSWLIID